MNILYIIGNGFDIAQNIKTSFTDFLKYYINRPIDGRVEVSSLKASISDNINTWADFEKQFGLYTSHFESANQYQEVMDDIRENLESYLTIEQNKFMISQEKTNKILRDLFYPCDYLLPLDKTVIPSDNFPKVDIVTLNYTDTMEKVLGQKVPFVYSRSKESVESISSLIHVHGVLGDTILFGVNDVSQIANEKLAKEEDVQNELIKPKANNGMHNTINRDVERLISASRLIVLFGTSIGETDNKWWEFIGSHLKYVETHLIYFVKSDFVYDPKKAYKYGLECDRHKNALCERLNIPKESEIRNRIVVCPNSKMFQIERNN